MSNGEDSVKQWLASIGCAELADVFAANAITVALLPTLTEEDLHELGIDGAPRATLLAAIAALNSPPPAPLAPAPTRAAAPSPKPPPAPRPASPKPAAKRQPAPPPPPPPPPAPRPALPTAPEPVRGADEPIPVVVAQPASRGIPVWAFVTIVSLLLVIIGLLVGGFFLWKNPQRPAVAAAPAKAAKPATPSGPTPIVLAAKTAKLAGSLAFDPAKNVVSNWLRPGDYLEWRAPIRTAGKYSVQLEYSRQPASGAVICEIGGQKVRANVASTGDWNKFTRATLGSIQVAKAGDQPLKLRSGSPTKGGLVNVRTLTLTPAK